MPNETTTTIRINSETGTTAYDIAEYLLKKENLTYATEQFKCKIAEWIVTKNNNNYRFIRGTYGVIVPLGKTELAQIGNEIFFATASGTRYTAGPKGWMLTKTGLLVRGKTGWLVDENGLYILQDGRRLDEAHKEEIDIGLFIGDKDIWKGLDKILGINKYDGAQISEYKTSELLEKYCFDMDEVVFQAFQINICYKCPDGLKYWKYRNCKFESIGTDETGIPIVVTRIGPLNATKKIVIAGPHGNERIARFVVLETQKYFMKNGLSNTDLALYFIPAMSPTLFFADTRGLPFVLGGDKYKRLEAIYKYSKEGGEETIIKKTINEICEFLTIPKLHDFMEEKINGELVHDLIQYQKDSKKPEYGIDANRDCHNALESTKAFEKFILSLKAKPGNITVFMMHGYEDRKLPFNRMYPDNITGQGVVYGPYDVIGDIMYLNDEKMRYSDLVSLCLFGYKNFKIKEGNEVERLKNYIYDNIPKMYYGEWSQKLHTQGINCYDIELSENYRQGTRGKIGDQQYSSDFVINRRNDITQKGVNNMRFFKEKDSGKFVSSDTINLTFVYQTKEGKNISINQNINLSFFSFLINFYSLYENAKKYDCMEVK